MAERKKKSTAEKELGKALDRLPAATKVLIAVFLILGIGIGGALTYFLSRNDRFLLVGETHFSVDAGEEPYYYTEEGVEAIQFGRDVSGKLHVETELEQDANGNYVIPTDEEGVYTITYTVDAYKFQKGENGVIKRIRTFTVNAAEEDGRNG